MSIFTAFFISVRIALLSTLLTLIIAPNTALAHGPSKKTEQELKVEEELQLLLKGLPQSSYVDMGSKDKKTLKDSGGYPKSR